MSRSSVKGVKSFRRKMKRLGPVMDDAIIPALERSSKRVYDAAHAKVPRDTGALADTLASKVYKGKLQAVVGWWKKGNKKNWLDGGWRAHFVEGGTKGGAVKRGMFAGAVIPPQAPRPMLAPAFKETLEANRKDIDDSVERGLRKVGRGV